MRTIKPIVHHAGHTFLALALFAASDDALAGSAGAVAPAGAAAAAAPVAPAAGAAPAGRAVASQSVRTLTSSNATAPVAQRFVPKLTQIPPMKPTSLEEKAGAMSAATGQLLTASALEDGLVLSARHTYEAGRGFMGCYNMEGFGAGDDRILMNGDSDDTYCRVQFTPWKGVKPYLFTIKIFADDGAFSLAFSGASGNPIVTKLNQGWNTLMFAVKPSSAQEQSVYIEVQGKPEQPWDRMTLRQVEITASR
jgi:hypothetical protein